MAAFFKDSSGVVFTAVAPGAAAPEGFEAIEANSTDAATEKHVPVVEVEHEGRLIRVRVGENEHPMEDAHYIEWIAFETADRVEIHTLKPGQSPLTYFAGGAESGRVYAYCNLHGLWVKDF